MREANRRAQASDDLAARRSCPRAANGTHRFGHVLAVLFLLAGLASQLGAAGVVAAPVANANAPAAKLATFPAFPAPQSVIAVGDFQTQLGCSAFDKGCQASALQNDGSGIWTGSFTVKPGSYSFRIFTRGDQDRSFGKGGDPNGDDLKVQVPDGSTAVYFAFDQNTGEITGAASSNKVDLQTGAGTVAMAPDGNGAFTAAVSGQAGGALTAQVIVDGQPAGPPQQINAGPSGRVKVTADLKGQIQGADQIQTATLTVAKTGADGSPAAGSCFGVFAGGTLAGQACDGDDGAEDGTTTINFPNGVPSGATLRETKTPDGGTAGKDQPVNLQPGPNQAVVAIGGGNGKASPGNASNGTAGNGGNGNATGNASNVVTGNASNGGNGNASGNVSNGTANGTAGNGGNVSNGSNGNVSNGSGGNAGAGNVSNGSSGNANGNVSNGSGNASGNAVGETPTEVPTQETAPTETPAGNAQGNGSIQNPAASAVQVDIYSTDPSNNALPGACYSFDGGDPICDTKGTGFVSTQLTPGDHTLKETQAPKGYTGIDTQTITVSAGGDTFPIQHTQNAPAGGTLHLNVVDENGQPLTGACFALDKQGASKTHIDVCDGDSTDADGAADGIVTLTGLSTGKWKVKETTAPQGHDAPGTFTIDINAGETTENQVVNKVSPPPAGKLTISVADGQGNALSGACFTVDPTAGKQCANGTDLTVSDLAPGTYTVTQTSAPSGFEVDPNPQQIDVKAGATATAKFADAPTPTPTAVPTGTVSLRYNDAQSGNPVAGACFTVASGAQTFGPVCDGDSTDQDKADGRVQINDVPAGDYTVTQTKAPDGYLTGDPVSITVTASRTTKTTISATRATGSVEVATTSGGKAVAGACYALDGGKAVCDDGGTGAVTFDNVAAGDHTVTQTSVPAGYVASDPTDQKTTVEAGKKASLSFEAAVQTGAIDVSTQENGNAVNGACYSLDDGKAVCDSKKTGSVAFEKVAPGDHTVKQTKLPSGYTASNPDSQTATVTGGQRAALTFEVGLANGSIVVKTSANGAPAGSACYALDGGKPVCDDNGTGEVTFNDVAPGDHTVMQTKAPDGYQKSENQTVSVKAGAAATVDVPVIVIPATNTPTATATATDVPTETPTKTATATVTDTATATATGTATNTPTATATATKRPTNTATATTAPTNTATATATKAPTNTATATKAPTQTATAPATATQTPKATSTATTAATVTATATTAATATATAQPQMGSVVIVKTDDTGRALGGSCFELAGPANVGPICDNQDGDGNPAAGTIAIANVPAGDYTLTETQTPDGYSGSAPVTLTVAANKATNATVVNTAQAPATGSLHLVVQDENGNPLGAACFTVAGTNYCDNGPDDSDNAGGSIQLAGLAVGKYTVSASTVPSGYDLPKAQDAQIVAGQSQDLVFKLTKTPPQTGGLQFDMKDASGKAVNGACIQLASNSAGVDKQYCDNGPDDSDSAAGTLVVKNLPVGVYYATQANQAASGSGASPAFKASSSDAKTVTVQANVIIVIVIIIIITPPSVGDLQVVKRASDSNLLQLGSCFKIDGPGGANEICDNDGSDGSASVGVIRFNGLPLGSYTVTETTAPPGYQAAPPQTVTVAAGLNSALFKDQPVVNTKGGLIVNKQDESGTALKGSCFELLAGTTVVAGPACDADDGANDGKVTFTNVEKGSYTLRETKAPTADYSLAADVTVTIIAGKNDTAVTVADTLKPGTLTIIKTTQDGTTPLGGSCFGLDRGAGIEYEVCDQQTGDGNSNAGTLYWPAIPAGNWTLVETQAPLGYNAAADQAIVIKPGQALALTVKDIPTPPPADTGTVVVKKTGEDNKALAGACFALRLGTMTKYSRCDATDGKNDGTITFTNVGVGTYVLRETNAPSADYLLAADQTIKVVKNQTATVTVKDIKKTGRIVVNKTNQTGDSLQNACFTISPDPNGVGKQCTSASGQVTFDKLSSNGTYAIAETQAPAGYQPAPNQTGIVVKPGLTTTVNVLDKKTPPPPTDGSILVIKFFCPVTKGVTSKSLIIDSSHPGSNQLPKTANCTKGDATFRLTAPGGEGGYSFNTGADGEYHATLAKGAWSLKETAPNNTGPTASIAIYASQQTTVVVVDYVQPPAPKPVTVNVVKYTCAPGFSAVYFADFMANCSNSSQLTNGISFRITGDATVKRITGSNGSGKSSFTNLPAGSFTLIEDLPNANTSAFGFCGYDPANPQWKTATGKLAFTLGQGDVYSCTWFDVPDLVTQTTGVIIVHKYVCDAATYPANFDWYGNCAVKTDGAKFSISTLKGDQWVQAATATTNGDGLLWFNALKPGVYQLKEIGANWCHAESNSVNGQGNVVVKANARSEVWIFDCVPTKSPPNTGVGPNAKAGGAMNAPMSGIITNSNVAIWLGFAWPLLALAGWRLRKKERRALHRAV